MFSPFVKIDPEGARQLHVNESPRKEENGREISDSVKDNSQRVVERERKES